MYSARNLSDIEVRLLEALHRDSRTPLSKLARELGVSRSTAARTLASLLRRGVIARFTLDLNLQGGFRVFARFHSRPEGLEFYELLDGTYLAVFEASSLADLKSVFDRVGRPAEYMVAVAHVRPTNMPPVPLVCDVCGKHILGQPYTYRRGRRTLYACCETCLGALQNKKRWV